MNLSHYELLLFKLRQDLDRLKGIESHHRKAQLKRERLPAYRPWLAGVLASDAGRRMQMLVRLLDVSDIKEALYIGDYVLRHGLPALDDFERATACLIAEEVISSAQRNLNGGRPLDTEQLLRARPLLAGQDMPDKIKACLLKCSGYRAAPGRGRRAGTGWFRQPLAQDEAYGVKTNIKQLEKRLDPATNHH